jgi:hypothetical protein
MKRHVYAVYTFAFVVLVGGLALAACGPGTAGGGGGSSTPSATASASVGTTANAVAPLKHHPTGGADISWDPSSKDLTARVNLTGLAPSSEHAAHIYAGACAAGGAAVYTFTPLTADAKGAVSTTQTFHSVATGIPATGWFINVHNGTTGDTYATMDIACADITNHNPNTTQAQMVHVDFKQGYGPSQNASGQTTLAIKNGNQLVVTITLHGLEPTSVHKAHIHTGSCQSQGDVVHPLNDATADSAGNATSVTTIANVTAIPTGGWYVNVHRGVNMTSPIDFDPIACGDVTAS